MPTSSIDGMLPPTPLTPPYGERTAGGNNAFHNFYNDYSHIAEPNLRRRLALSEIDKVPFSLYHVRAILVAGVGFFLDSYDIFAINLITTLLGMVFWSGSDGKDGFGGNNGILPSTINQALKMSTTAGMVIGMIGLGWMADRYGRRRMYGVVLGIIVLSTFCCALVSASPSITSSGLLIFWRVVMGMGIGGDYPLSAVITSEFAPTRWRGGMIAAVFSMQGIGQLMAAVVALITAVGFRSSFGNVTDVSLCDAACRVAADRSWRIVVGVGAIPACLALYYRVTIPETPRYTFDVEHDIEKAGADIKAYVSSKSKGDFDIEQQARLKKIAGPSLEVPRASWMDLFHFFKTWKNLKMLIGTTLSWFCLDFAFYGLGLNQAVVLEAIGFSNGKTLFHQLYNEAVGSIILACAGSIPGYWVAVFTIDTVGRKPLQVLGFLCLTIIFCILGFMLQHLNQSALLALYVVCQFLFNAGPNSTTFVVPGECFPTRYRASGHGISAAFGKIGAIVAEGISIPLLNNKSLSSCVGKNCPTSLERLMQIFALFALLGTLVSLLIPETRGLTLEELSGEPRTSYNAGCNGSINMGSARSRNWNPFHGGRAAGFNYPRAHTNTYFRDGRTQRVGIMTAPDVRAESERRRRRFWRRSNRSTASREEPQGYAMSSRSSAAEEMYSSTAVDIHAHQQPPTWGAGWGRIDRGGPPPLVNSSRLQDVGQLLSQ